MSTKKWWEEGYDEKEHQKDLASVHQQQQTTVQEENPDNNDNAVDEGYNRIAQTREQHKVFKLEEQKDILAQKIINTMDVKSDDCRMKLEAIRDFIDIILRSENK